MKEQNSPIMKVGAKTSPCAKPTRPSPNAEKESASNIKRQKEFNFFRTERKKKIVSVESIKGLLKYESSNKPLQLAIINIKETIGKR